LYWQKNHFIVKCSSYTKDVEKVLYDTMF